MSDIAKIQLFENKKVRTAWDEDKQEWFFSIVNVCGILAEQPDYEGAIKNRDYPLLCCQACTLEKPRALNLYKLTSVPQKLSFWYPEGLSESAGVA